MSIGLTRSWVSPVFTALAIDASASVSDCVEDVASAHQALLSALRSSEKCEEGGLYLRQTLFADDVSALNPWLALDPNGNDSVTQLTAANYQPGGQTALYDAVYELLLDVGVEIEALRQAGLRASARVVVIAGSGDKCSRIAIDHTIGSAEQMIRDEVQKLRDREWLSKSLVIGLERSRLSADMLEETRKRLGFAQSMLLNTGRANRDIRRAFQLNAVPDRSPLGPA